VTTGSRWLRGGLGWAGEGPFPDTFSCKLLMNLYIQYRFPPVQTEAAAIRVIRISGEISARSGQRWTFLEQRLWRKRRQKYRVLVGLEIKRSACDRRKMFTSASQWRDELWARAELAGR